MNKNTLIGLLGIAFVAWGIHYYLIDKKYKMPETIPVTALATEKENDVYETEFERVAPKPFWWNHVQADHVKITNYDELIAYWQSEKRCCTEKEIKDNNRKFYKTAYLAILNNPSNPDIIVNGINLMNLSYLGIDDFSPMQLYALETYPDYNKPLHRCANCKKGDVIASLLEELGGSLRKKNQQGDYIPLAKHYLSLRGGEMSEYYEARIYLQIAYAYENLKQNEIAQSTLIFMFERYMFERYKNAPQTGSLKSTMTSAQQLLEKLQSL